MLGELGQTCAVRWPPRPVCAVCSFVSNWSNNPSYKHNTRRLLLLSYLLPVLSVSHLLHFHHPSAFPWQTLPEWSWEGFNNNESGCHEIFKCKRKAFCCDSRFTFESEAVTAPKRETLRSQQVKSLHANRVVSLSVWAQQLCMTAIHTTGTQTHQCSNTFTQFIFYLVLTFYLS